MNTNHLTHQENIVSIQDYILDMETEKAPSTTYEIVLANNTDFIVARSTLKTRRELVILISKGLYYIKDAKNGSIESVSLSLLKSFLRDLKDGLRMDSVHWLPVLDKDSAERIDCVISDEVFVEMCRHNALTGIQDPGWYKGYWQQSSKLFMQLCAMYPTMADNVKYKSSLPLVFELNKKMGYNEAVYFAERFVQTGIQQFSPASQYNHYNQAARSCDGFMGLIENAAYGLQLRRFIDYVLFDLYAQGVVNIDSHFWREYRDYLEMQIQFYGKVKDKYPANFKTEHDVITLKINQMKAVQECQDFEERAREIESLAHQAGIYCIVIPTHPQELAEEGVSLSHCVMSYISRVTNGECHILFLRKANAPEHSLVTLQLSGNAIVQAQGAHRRAITDEERRFLLQWSAEKSIDIAI